MYHQRPKKENNECQTDLQCTPFILNENETARVHSSRLCQTEIQLSPRAPDTELYKIIPYIDQDDIEKDAICLMNIARTRKIKLQFRLPVQNTDSPLFLGDDDTITDRLDEEVTYVRENENLQCFSSESFHKNEPFNDIDSVSSVGTLKSAIKKILREDGFTQTDLMIAPHILNDTEKPTITIHNSCQTSLTCTPRTSLTEVVPMLRSYWEHEGETRQAFNKSENVLEILKEIIQDVINIHQHMFDPDYNPPNMNSVLVKVAPKISSMESSEWDTVSPSKTTKKPDVCGDNASVSEVDSIFNKNVNEFKQSEIASISTISEITTLESSDYTLSSTKDDEDDDDDDDDDNGDNDNDIDDDNDDDNDDDISNILERLKKKYTNSEEIENLSNVKEILSDRIISPTTEPIAAANMMANTNNSSGKESNVELFGSELWSDDDSNRSLHIKEVTPDDAVKDVSHNCQKINDNCVCSGIKVKLYLKEKFDTNRSLDRFIEMKINPDLESVEIKKLLNISTDPELAEIPFQEIENCLKNETDDQDSTDDLANFFDIEDQDEPINADICKTDGFEIKINIPKKSAMCPQTTSEEFLHSFLLTNFLMKDIEKAPYPEMLQKVSFPNKTSEKINKDNTDAKMQLCLCGCDKKIEETIDLPNNTGEKTNEEKAPYPEMLQRVSFLNKPSEKINKDNTDPKMQFCVCGCDKKIEETTDVPKTKKPVSVTPSPFTTVFSRLCEDPDNLIPFDAKDSSCGCNQHSENIAVLSDVDHETLSGNTDSDVLSAVCNSANVEHILENVLNFNHEAHINDLEDNLSLQNMSSYVVLPTIPVKLEYDDCTKAYVDVLLKPPEIVSKQTRSQTNSVAYEGHIYETDFISGAYDGSDDSIHSNIDKPMPSTLRKHTVISYEEHMYKSGSPVQKESETSVEDQDCICAQKMEDSLKECPHCFRRIGPQYGRDQRGLNDDYDQPYEKEPTDFCSTKQNTTEDKSRMDLLRYPSRIFGSNYNTKPNPINVFNLKEKSRITFSEGNIIQRNNLMKWNNNITSESNTTKNADASNNLIERTNNITEKFTSESYTSKNVNAFNNHTSESNTTKNADASNNLIESTNNITEKFTSESYTSKNVNAFINHTSERNIKKKLDASENSRRNVDGTDKDDPSKYVIFTEQIYPTGKIVIGKMDTDDSDTIKPKNSDSKSKCYSCYGDDSCPKILCDVTDIVKHPLNHGCCKSAVDETPSLGKVITDREEKHNAKPKYKCQTCSKAKRNQTSQKTATTAQDNKIIADMGEKYKATSKTKCQICMKVKQNQTSKKIVTVAQDTPAVDKINADMGEKFKATSKTKCQPCSRAKLNQISNKNSTTSKTKCQPCSKAKLNQISNKNSTTSKTKCQPCSKAKLNQISNKNSTTAYTTTSETKCQPCSRAKLNQISNKNSTTSETKCQPCSKAKLNQISNKNSTTAYKTTSETKCQTCSKSKLNQTSNMVPIEGICSICSSNSELVEVMQYNAKFNTSNKCSAICNNGNGKSGVKLEEKRSMGNLQKSTQIAKISKKCLSCSNLVNKDSHISSTLMQPTHLDKSSKSLTAPRTKCSTCKKVKGKKSGHTIQVLYPPKSKSSNCTCIKSRCRQTQNMEETVCLMEPHSVKNKFPTCTASKQKSKQHICSHKLLHQVKSKLESLPQLLQCRQNNAECPGPPYNSPLTNCKCSKCIFSKQLNEVNKCNTYHSSKCQNLPYCSIQKIFEKNIPCSCSSSSTNEIEAKSDQNLNYLTRKINSCIAKCNQNKDTPKTNSKIAKQKEPMLSEQIMSASYFDSKNKYPTENTTQMKEEKVFNDEMKVEDLLSTFSIITQPRVRILDTPKYVYKSDSSVSNGEFLLVADDSVEISLYNSVGNSERYGEEFLWSSVSESDKHVNVEPNASVFNAKAIKVKPENTTKTMNVHKLDGKYSVFSIVKKHETAGSETTVYILPNAVFSSLFSIPPPHFLRERTESEIDDIIQFSYIRNLHYERNPEFDQRTNATAYSACNSEEFINIIADQNLPSMNCSINCNCSSSVPINKEQQTDEILDYIKVDKTTSNSSLQAIEDKAHISLQNNPVGIHSSYILCHNNSHSQITSFSSILKPYKKQNIIYEDNVKLLENASYKVDPSLMQIVGKYITWQDLIFPNLYNPKPIQNAITSLEPCIDCADQKIHRGIQTSNTSFISALPEPSLLPPLTIEASTSTGNLEMETSMISFSRYHLSEKFSTIDLPLECPTTSDSSISTEHKTIRFQTPSVDFYSKKTISTILTLEASTSTTSRNQALAQTDELPNNSISLANIISPDQNLIEEETTSISKCEAFLKTSQLPTKKTSSISLTRIDSPYEHAALETSYLKPETSTSKEQTNIGFSSTSSTYIALPIIDSILQFPETLIKSQKTSTNDMTPSTSLTKFTLSNISTLPEPSLPKLENVESYSQIPLPEDQISCLSLPKVESLDSLSESNCGPIDTDTNVNKINKQEWSYPEEKEILHKSRKFIYKTSSPSELSVHSKENLYISANSIHDDISVSKKNSPAQNQPLLKSELVNENNVYSASPTPDEEDHHHKFNSNTFDKYHNLDFKIKTNLNKELNDSLLNTCASKDFEEDPVNIPQEHIHKNLQLENLLCKAIDAYTAYLTLKKGITSNFNISKIDFPYQNTDTLVYSEYTEENNKDFLKKDQPIQHDSREHLADGLTPKPDDSYSAYLKIKDRISSSISISKMDSTYKDENTKKLSNTNAHSYNIDNSRDDFLYKTEQAYSKILKRKNEPSNISVTNIYSSFEQMPNDFQTETNLANNSSSLDSEASTTNDSKADSFTSKNKEHEVSPLPSVLKKSSYSNNSTKTYNYKDLRSDKFIFKKGDGTSVSSTGKEEISILNRDLHNSTDEKIKTEKDICSIESEYSEILKRKQTIYPRVSRNSNQRLFSFKNEDSYLKRLKEEEILSLSPLPSVKDTDLAYTSIAVGESNYTLNLKKEDDYLITNKNEDRASLIKENSPYQYSNNRPNTSRDLKSDKFIFNTKDNYSAYPIQKGEISEKTSAGKDAPPYQQSLSKKRSSRDLKSNGYFIYRQKEETISPRRSTSKVAPSYPHAIPENKSSRNPKPNIYSTYLQKEETISPRRSTSRVAPSYPHAIPENKSSRNSKSNVYSTYLKKEETISPKRSPNKVASSYLHTISESMSSRDLKSNEYPTYQKKEEIISPRRSTSKITPSHSHYISENKSSRNLKPSGYSLYSKKEETFSPKRSTSKVAPPYPHYISENRNSRDLKSNKFIYKPESKERVSTSRNYISENKNSRDLTSNKFIYNPETRERVSSPRNLKTEQNQGNSVLNNNLANSKNSATSKLSSFVRNGTTSVFLSNIGDSPQPLSMETIDHILPDIAVSSHRVLETVQSCEQRLEPIKCALKDIKMKLKELNMPEVNGIFQNDQLVDENNKTYIYLPPPPPPLLSSRCSYRTKMTFQLKKPMKPLGVTGNANPSSIKHKYILNDDDDDNNPSNLNTNYSSVSDSYNMQRTSINSKKPSFNQPSYSENKPLHSQRYYPDTYIERSHTTRKPVEVIEEDLPFSAEDLQGRKDMDEFQQHHQHMPNNHDTYYYQPQSESMNNYVMFETPVMKRSRVYVPVSNAFNKTDEHVFNSHNTQNNMKMFTGDYPAWKNKSKK